MNKQSKVSNKLTVTLLVAFGLLLISQFVPPLNGVAGNTQIKGNVSEDVFLDSVNAAVDRQIAESVKALAPLANKAKRADSLQVVNSNLRQDIKELKTDNRLLKKKISQQPDSIVIIDTLYIVDTIKAKRKKILGIF